MRRKNRTPLVSFLDKDKEFDKKIEKTIKILTAKKPAAKTLSVNDTGKIKILKKPFVPLLLGVRASAGVRGVRVASVGHEAAFIHNSSYTSYRGIYRFAFGKRQEVLICPLQRAAQRAQGKHSRIQEAKRIYTLFLCIRTII